MKIHILDPAVRRLGGHYFEFDRRIGEQIQAAGHDVRYFVSQYAEVEMLTSLGRVAEVQACFSTHPHQPASKLDPFAGELIKYTDHSYLLQADLQKLPQADVWLWPTFYAPQLFASALTAKSTKVVGCLHFDPGIAAASDGAKAWRHAFVMARRTGLNCSLGTIESELVHRFVHLFPEKEFQKFPYPTDGMPVDKPKQQLKTVGIFGQQRTEKGVNLMPVLIQGLLQAEYQVVLHDSTRSLSIDEHPNLRYLNYVDNLAAEIVRCDLVLLPYNLNSYQSHGSGILMDCLSSGIPVVGPAGTLPGRTIEQWRVGTLFYAHTANAMLHAVNGAKQNFQVYAANAFEASRYWLKTEGSRCFVDAVLKACR